MKFLSLVWSNLKRKKLRTWLTLLSICVAFLLFGLLCAIKEAFTAGVSMADADRLIVRHKVSLIMPLPESYRRRMEQIAGVETAVHLTWFNGIYQNEPKNFFASMPVSDPETFLTMWPEYLLPAEQKQAWLTTRSGAIVGRALADRFGWKMWRPGAVDVAALAEQIGRRVGIRFGRDLRGGGQGNRHVAVLFPLRLF